MFGTVQAILHSLESLQISTINGPSRIPSVWEVIYVYRWPARKMQCIKGKWQEQETVSQCQGQNIAALTTSQDMRKCLSPSRSILLSTKVCPDVASQANPKAMPNRLNAVERLAEEMRSKPNHWPWQRRQPKPAPAVDETGQSSQEDRQTPDVVIRPAQESRACRPTSGRFPEDYLRAPF